MTIADQLWQLILKRLPTDALLRLRDIAEKRERGEAIEQSVINAVLAVGDGSDCRECGHAAALHGLRGACLIPGCSACHGYGRLA
jgi:hypothetical protein